MSKIKNGGLDQYGAEPFEQQQFGTAGVEGVNRKHAYTQMFTTKSSGFDGHEKFYSHFALCMQKN